MIGRLAKPALLAALAALSLPGPGRAQDQGSQDPGTQDHGTQALQAFMATRPYQELTARTLAGIPPAVFTRCPALAAKSSAVTILETVTAGPQGRLTAGKWKQSFPVSGCGNDTVLNLYFSVAADGKPQAFSALPGTTLADPLLQRDALLYAHIGAARVADNCKNFLVIDTKADASAGQAAQAGQRLKAPWSERWTLLGCKRKVAVRMDFIPDATGTTITPRDAAILPD